MLARGGRERCRSSRKGSPSHLCACECECSVTLRGLQFAILCCAHVARAALAFFYEGFGPATSYALRRRCSLTQRGDPFGALLLAETAAGGAAECEAKKHSSTPRYPCKSAKPASR